MVSNFKRILDEIRKEAHGTDLAHEIEAEAIVKLIMTIVDLEDKNRVKAVAGINQQVKGMIENATHISSTKEDM